MTVPGLQILARQKRRGTMTPPDLDLIECRRCGNWHSAEYCPNVGAVYPDLPVESDG